jgi:hypothetical protein
MSSKKCGIGRVGRGHPVRDVARRDAGPVQQEFQLREHQDRGGTFGASVTMRTRAPSHVPTADSPASMSVGMP